MKPIVVYLAVAAVALMGVMTLIAPQEGASTDNSVAKVTNVIQQHKALLDSL